MRRIVRAATSKAGQSTVAVRRHHVQAVVSASACLCTATQYCWLLLASGSTTVSSAAACFSTETHHYLLLRASVGEAILLPWYCVLSSGCRAGLVGFSFLQVHFAATVPSLTRHFLSLSGEAAHVTLLTEPVTGQPQG